MAIASVTTEVALVVSVARPRVSEMAKGLQFNRLLGLPADSDNFAVVGLDSYLMRRT